jgi:hypothetical protein
MFYDEMADKMSVDTDQLSYSDKKLILENSTKNEYPCDEQEFFRDKAVSLVNQSLICGYKNAESNVEDLNFPLYEKYFAVPTDLDESD